MKILRIGCKSQYKGCLIIYLLFVVIRVNSFALSNLRERGRQIEESKFPYLSTKTNQ